MKDKSTCNVLIGMGLVACLSSAPVTHGEVAREVASDGEGRVRITLNWQLAYTPDSCIILREELPSGWTFDPASLDPMVAACRQETDAVHFAIGINERCPSTGSITYSLESLPEKQTDTLRFSGRAQTMRTAQRQVMPIAGDQTYALSRPNPYMPLKPVKAKAPGEGFQMEFYEDDPTQTVYVEYTMSPASVPWQCIHTSYPGDRISSPGVIDVPPNFSGFFRLRY